MRYTVQICESLVDFNVVTRYIDFWVLASLLCHSVTPYARFWCSPLGENVPAQTVCYTESWPRKQHTYINYEFIDRMHLHAPNTG